MIKEYLKRRKLNKMKSKIKPEYLDLLADDKDYYEVEKLFDWLDLLYNDFVSWEEFYQNWHRCPKCEFYDNQKPCSCKL